MALPAQKAMPAPLPWPRHTPAIPGARWVEVVSHLDARYGGLSATVPRLSLSLELERPNMDVSLAAFCAPGEHVTPTGFELDQLSFWPAARGPWLRDRLQGNSLRRSLQAQMQHADGIHIHGLWESSTAVAGEAARALGKPYILSAHGMLEPWALANKRLKKLLYARLVERANVAGARCLHALTQAEARHFIRFGARAPIAVIPNAVDCPRSTNASLFLDRFPELKEKRIVLFLARLHPKKGLDLLVKAWASVQAEFPDAHLVLAGPDSEGTQARLEQMIANDGLQHVLFPGMLRGPMKWSALAAAELFVLPSFSEGLSVSVLEAMGMGVPVLITEPCNMPEVERADAGWVIQPEVKELRGALHTILRATPAQNAAVGQCGARLVQKRYTWPVVASQMAEVYAWVLGGPMPQGVDMVFPA